MFQRENSVGFIQIELCNLSCDRFNEKWLYFQMNSALKTMRISCKEQTGIY